MSFLKQGLLVAGTAVIVAVIIPSFYKPSYPVPVVFGTVAPGFENVKEVFRENYEENWDNREAGSAFSVYYKGKNVVDLWAGFADVEAKRLWKEDTMTVIFSTTKGLTALCVAMLAERGYLDFTKPVAYYWPEFAQNGKEKITVEQLLEHEAGLLATDSPLSYDILRNFTAVDKILAETTPKWEPGTRHGYHGITYGPYVDAIVRRVDPKKRSIGQFFDEEVRKPFDIDAYLGAPLELDYRIGRCTNVQARFSDILYALLNVKVIRTLILGKIFTNNESGKFDKLMYESCGDICEFERLADADLRTIEVASLNGVSTARAIAKLFGILANGGKQGNNTLLSSRMIDKYINDKRGLTPDLFFHYIPARWKYGMDLIPQRENAGNIFGASGLGGQVGYADPNLHIGYGFISRYMSPMGIQMYDPRFKRLKDSVVMAIKSLQEN